MGENVIADTIPHMVVSAAAFCRLGTVGYRPYAPPLDAMNGVTGPNQDRSRRIYVLGLSGSGHTHALDEFRLVH